MTIMAVVAAFAANATQITVGSYNVRVKVADDTGVHSWDVRKDYVARTVIDNGFEVVGFNEVRTGDQYDDLTGLLPGYAFHSWDGFTGYEGSATSVDLIAYRKDRFELLDSGWYFLCRDTGAGLHVWEASWDNSSFANVRHASWVKLKVKDSGEIFYLFCTHLDHKGNIARMLQAQLNYEKMWEIAGHYPTIMVGDQNSTTSRVNYLNLYKAGFTDAFSVVKNPAEKFGKEDPATSGQWNADPTTGRRIDYIWTRGFKVDSYDHCTNMYDLGAMPSDHIAITAKLTFEDYDIHNRYHYVAPGAGGAGTIEAPFGTIQDAVNAARVGDTIYVAAGDYEVSRQIDVKKSVRLFGGYDEGFSKVVGLSSVRANGNVRCFMLNTATDVEMRNIGVYGGNVPDTEDGGGICAHGSRLILRNCELSDNVAGRDGGAIDCSRHLILDRVIFKHNKAGRNGGAVCYDNPNKRYWYNFPIEHCLFEGNEAVDGSAIYLPRFLYTYISGNTFVSNTATNGSTAYIYAYREPERLGAYLTVMNNTFALNQVSGEGHASALYVDIEPEAPFALLNNTIVSNASDAGVAAVYMQQGVPYVCNNIIACNEGGDVFLNSSGVTANYNLYTSESSISYRVSSRDIYAADMTGAVAGLSAALDGETVDGKFVPMLSLPGEGDAAAVTADGGGEYLWSGVPAIKVTNPVWDSEKSLNSVTAMRMREDVNRADINNDCMKERTVSLTFDQHGNERPLDGKATMGALEYVAPAGIEGVVSDGATDLDADAPVEYFDLQGRRVQNPSNGIFIRRQGTHVEKVVR